MRYALALAALLACGLAGAVPGVNADPLKVIANNDDFCPKLFEACMRGCATVSCVMNCSYERFCKNGATPIALHRLYLLAASITWRTVSWTLANLLKQHRFSAPNAVADTGVGNAS